MKTYIHDSRIEGRTEPLSHHPLLNDIPRALRQSKRPVEEVKLLMGAVQRITRYLDGLEDGKTLRAAQLDVEKVWFGI